MAHKHPGYRFENDWEPEWAVNNAKNTAAGIALPVYEEIKLNNTVLNLESVKRYLEKAHKIAIQDCPCRTKLHHCDAPRDVCVQLNDAAEKGIARGTSREVTIEEALDAVTRAHEAGLVPMAYVRTDSPKPEGVNYVCNCCSCCCSILGATLRFGMAPHILKSIATTMTDESKCILRQVRRSLPLRGQKSSEREARVRQGSMLRMRTLCKHLSDEGNIIDSTNLICPKYYSS